MIEELRLDERLARVMIDHCIAGRPNEACGLLAAKGGAVVHVIPMNNAAASPVRYALDPKEQFDAYRMIERDGLDLAAVYHSHTRTEARPSPTDIRLATEDVPYVIVSLMAEPAVIRAFRIVKENWTDETGDVQEMPVRVEG